MISPVISDPLAIDDAPLTPRQQEVYQFIRSYFRLRRCCPAIRDIAKHFAIRSTNGVVCHLNALEAKGYLYRQPGIARSLVLTREAEALPLVGIINAGGLMEAIPFADWINLRDMVMDDSVSCGEAGNTNPDRHIAKGDLMVFGTEGQLRAVVRIIGGWRRWRPSMAKSG